MRRKTMPSATKKTQVRPSRAVSIGLLLVFSSAAFSDEDAERLVSAIQGGDIELVASLLADGVSPDARHGKDKAMTWAAGLGELGIMDLLYAQGVQLDADAALAAATEGQLDALTRLIGWGVEVDAVDPYDMSLLMTAALHGHANVVEYLLHVGASASTREVVQGYTPLILAAAHGHVEVVRLLIESGADVNAQTDEGENAMSWARERADHGESYRQVIALLSAAGASD